MKNKSIHNQKKNKHLAQVFSLFIITLVFSVNIVFAVNTPVFAQTLNTPTPEINPNSESFKIVVCDGPDMRQVAGNKGQNPEVTVTDSKGNVTKRPYVPCDFNGVMLQVQRLINIMMVLGVLVAIGMFSYAGFLYITGKQANIDKAHAIFPKVFFGFIIMLSAWFIVYQILSWLTGPNSGFKTLLGTP